MIPDRLKWNGGTKGLRFSLKATMPMISAFFLLLMAGLGVALMKLTSHLEETTRSVLNNVESVRVAEGLGSALLARQNALIKAFVPGSTYSTIQREELRQYLAEAKNHVGSTAEVAILAEVEKAVKKYIRTSDAMMTGSVGLPLFLTRTTPLVDRAYSKIRELIQNNTESARASFRQAEKVNANADRLGLLLIAIATITVGLLLVSLQSLVFEPLSAIHSSVVRFGLDSRSARAPLAGPVEVQTIAGAFNHMADRISNRERDQIIFLASVAHDLRNPLTAMRLPIHMLISENARRSLSKEQRREMITIVDRQIDRLKRMVSDFLDASRIQAGTLELRFSAQDLRELVQESVTLFKMSAPSHEFEVNMPNQPIILWFDPVRIGQILNNLISNAVKYSPRGGKVSIAIHLSDRGVSVAVSDQGIGIAPSEYQHIFEPFVQLGTSQEIAPGVGLGLSNTKKLVEAHGGRIDVSSTLGKGSTFIIWLPTHQTSDTAA